MNNYKIPRNVKQIGNIDENLRVYMEDYVYSYLLQYAKAHENEESIAILIGRCMIIDNKKVLFISGAIQGLHTEVKKGILTFSNETYDYIEEQRLKHFKGLEIVGWMLSQPGYGTYLSTGHMNYHIDNFKKPYQVMFVLDTIEKMNTFFQYDKEKSEIKEMEGFFVFYEKNLEMQEYIAENKIEVKVEDETDKVVKVRKPEVSEIKKEEPLEKIEGVEIEKNKEENKKENKEEGEEVEKNKINIVTIDKSKKVNKKQKAKLPSLNPQLIASAVVIGLVATMGFNVVKSESRIMELERDINVLTQAYNMLVTHINNTENVSQVFASSDVKIETPIIEEMPEEDEVKTNEELKSEELQEDDLSLYEESVEVEFIEDEDIDNEENSETRVIETFTTNKDNYYIVRQGDSLIGISRYIYGTDDMQQAIMDANNIEDPNKIYFGMKLLLP